jgi:endoglucanase
LNAPARLAWLGAVRETCEQQSIGWALWGYDDSMGFALRPPGGPRRLDPEVLRALGLHDAAGDK